MATRTRNLAPLLSEPRLLTVTVEEAKRLSAIPKRRGPLPSPITQKVRELPPGGGLLVQPCPHRLHGTQTNKGCSIRQIPYREWVLTGIHYTVRHDGEGNLFILRDA